MTQSAEARLRFDRLALASPLYARLLEQHPEHRLWLEEPRNLRTEFRYRALLDEWRAFRDAEGPPENDEVLLARLRRWRRLISLRIAYRSVNGLASEKSTVEELSRLAEFCLSRTLDLALAHGKARFGEPWDEAGDAPARFCILGLGKLGGQELNFSSDIDLVFVFAGEGNCRGRKPAPVGNQEFFTKIAETLIAAMGAPTADGFLFRVDARLRPDGAHGPLVPPFGAVETYYASSGQTWERLALLKARPVAGDLSVGAELLESLHPFRYPRHPPPSLLAEIAAMKRRMEVEIVGASGLDRDVKQGRGGIREIEFLAQAFQVLHAGRYPFLQTHATTTALEQLARYGLLDPERARALEADYWILRKIEHRIQMRDEMQTHELPSDPDERAAVARSLGFADEAALERDLAVVRARVHAAYAELFAEVPGDESAEAWWTFLADDRIPAPLAARFERWFGGDPAGPEALRALAGGGAHLVNRELIDRFRHLAESLDEWFPQLGRPVETLRRLERFAERYGTRRQFLETYAVNLQLFRVLALLFDRSGYIHGLLCAHPEILEEVLRPEILRRRKSAEHLAEELAAGPPGPEFPGWLWFYARAEQVRYAIGELLGFMTLEEVEAALSLLADATIREALVRAAGGRLLVVALGKYGGAELTFGSDLDLLFLAEDGEAGALGPRVDALREALSRGGPLLPAFPVDFRLRPHGQAGPAVVSWTALREYQAGSSAQFWERQLLTRARVVTGPADQAGRFEAFVRDLIYTRPLAPDEEAAIGAMRRRIRNERDTASPPERAFKTGAGGLVDFEFLAQTYQLRHGWDHPSLRRTGTRNVLRELARLRLIAPDAARELLAHYDFLKRIEILIRRDSYAAESVLPATPSERLPLARWLGFGSEAEFWADYTARLGQAARLIGGLLTK